MYVFIHSFILFHLFHSFTSKSNIYFFEIKMVSRNDVSAQNAETRILLQCVLQNSLLHLFL